MDAVDRPIRPTPSPRAAPPAFPATWPAEARSKLLAAMLACVAARGVYETRVEDVIRLARASRRTFYAHFDNQEACLIAACDAIRSDVLHVLGAGHADPERALRAVLAYFAQWPQHAYVLAGAALALGPAGAAAHGRLMGDVAARLRECSDPAGAGRGPLEDEDVAQVRLGGATHLIQHRVLTGRPGTLPDLSRDLAALLG